MTAASRRHSRVGCSEQGQACGLIWIGARTCSRLHCVLQTRTRRAACRTMTPPNLGVGYNDTSQPARTRLDHATTGGGNLCRRARPMILNRLCRACAGGRRHHPNHNKQGGHHGHLPHPHPHPHAQRGGGSRCVQLRQEVRSHDPEGGVGARQDNLTRGTGLRCSCYRRPLRLPQRNCRV